MPVVENDEIQKTRELLRQFSSPILLRAYEATPEDYEAIGDEDFKCEYLDGVLIVHSPATLEHEDEAGFVYIFLRDFASRHRLGRVFGANAVMQLGHRRFSPDISYLSVANENRVSGGRVNGPMDLVVEVLSSSTRSYDRGEKLAAYQAGRVPEIWLIDEQNRRFEAHVLRGDSYERAELSTGVWASPTVAGLKLDVSWLWRRPLPTLDECRAIST